MLKFEPWKHGNISHKIAKSGDIDRILTLYPDNLILLNQRKHPTYLKTSRNPG